MLVCCHALWQKMTSNLKVAVKKFNFFLTFEYFLWMNGINVKHFMTLSSDSLTSRAPETDGPPSPPGYNRTTEVVQTTLPCWTADPLSKTGLYEVKSAHKSRHSLESVPARCHVLGQGTSTLAVKVATGRWTGQWITQICSWKVGASITTRLTRRSIWSSVYQLRNKSKNKREFE